MNINDVIEHIGSQSDVARALGVTPQAVQQWVRDGKIPVTRQYQIEVVTRGKLKAPRGITAA